MPFSFTSKTNENYFFFIFVAPNAFEHCILRLNNMSKTIYLLFFFEILLWSHRFVEKQTVSICSLNKSGRNRVVGIKIRGERIQYQTANTDVFNVLENWAISQSLSRYNIFLKNIILFNSKWSHRWNLMLESISKMF